jgi:hypothetical protein
MMLHEKHDIERTGLFHTDQNALKNLLKIKINRPQRSTRKDQLGEFQKRRHVFNLRLVTTA